MATSNFVNSEYGIFVLPTLSVDDAADHLRDIDKELTEENINLEIAFYDALTAEYFPDNLRPALHARGVAMREERDHIICFDEDDRIIARLELHPGYYAGIQVLIEDDPEELLGDYYYQDSYREDYSDDIEPVLNALREITDEYKVYARFSSGETWYSKAGEL